MDPLDLSDFSGSAPLFPLPNIVFFPQTVLPLHIFEERYRAMTRDALDGERLIAMAHLKPGWEPAYQGAPAVYDVVGLGRIMDERRLPDGRFNIVLLSLSRARILDEDRSRDYRVGRLQLLEDRPAKDPRFEQVRLGLLAVYSTLMREKQPDWKAGGDMPLGLVCDLLAARLEIDPALRQELFEELDVAERAARLVDLIQRSPVAGKSVRTGLKEQGRSWPPDPSAN
jgi:hypothetical protein